MLVTLIALHPLLSDPFSVAVLTLDFFFLLLIFTSCFSLPSGAFWAFEMNEAGRHHFWFYRWSVPFLPLAIWIVLDSSEGYVWGLFW